jgi:hypothetical protein
MIFGKCGTINVNQSWATQIGSRAKFLLNTHVEGQNRDAFYRFSRFSYEKAIIQRLLKGRIKELKGPQVAHGCCKQLIFFLILSIFDKFDLPSLLLKNR